MSYTPDDTPAQFFAEETWLAGAIITGAGYGIVLALFWLCFRNLWCQVKIRDASRRRNICFLVYICLMAVLGSLFLASNSKFTQLAFINHRNFPGGPSAYEQQMFSVGVDEIGNVSFTLANWLADSLLVWRCVIISRDTGTSSSWIVPTVVPCLMQLASYVIGVFFLVQISSPSSSPYFNASKGINWTLPYLFISFAINIVVSIIITFRLLLYRRRMIQDLGPGHATESASLAAMIVESASLYSTFSLLFLIPFALKSPVSNIFLQVLGEAQLIAPLLIIYRESQGKGWISTSSATASTVTGNQAIRLGRFSDIQFASDIARGQSSHSTGVGAIHTLEEKEDTIEEVRREDVREGEQA